MSEAAGQDFSSTLRNSAAALVSQLEAGNFTAAMRVIHEINAAREESLYHEVGKLTRGLHDAIVSFQIDVLSRGGGGDKVSEFHDASERLNYVIELTENAANKTMDMVDDCMPVASQLGEAAEKLRGDWERLGKRELEPGEFRELYKQINDFLEYTLNQSSTLHNGLSNILVAQEYQDLTGQVIKRVIGLVQDVEDSLVSLVKMASAVEDAAGITRAQEENSADTPPREPDTKAEGPQVNAGQRPDVVSGQDEVDDLLSSLGF